MNFSANFFSKNIPHLTVYLKQFIDKPVRMLEIGCFEGMSTVWFLENILTHEYSSIICVDSWDAGSIKLRGVNWKEIYQRFVYNVDSRSQFIGKVQWHRQTSRDFFKTHRNQDFHIIHIDGAHDKKSVLFDSIMSWNCLGVGGILIFDDYDWKAPLEWSPDNCPKTAIDIFLNIFADEIKILHQSNQVIIKKLPHIVNKYA